MKHRLKIALAAALQLLAALPAAGVSDLTATRRRYTKGLEAGQVTLMSQRGGTRGRRASRALGAGVWGGERILFEVNQDGARIEYDCAHGMVAGKIVVDSRGRFSVSGMHYEEHAGPTRAGEGDNGYPVRLTGRVEGSLMKLTVTRAGSKEVVGTYTLARGRQAELVKCL